MRVWRSRRFTAAWKLFGLLGVGLLLTISGWRFYHTSRPSVGIPKTAASADKWSLPSELQQQLRQASQAPAPQAHDVYQQLAQLPARTSEEKYVVGYAHYQIGKFHAEQKQFHRAQQVFQKLAEQRISVPALPLDPSFGTWSEQGAYQAAICAYQLDPQQGLQQMIRFIEEYPASPLVVGAYKRILRWTNAKPPAAAEKAWHKAQAAQRERMKMNAACGPKALAYILKEEFGIDIDWKVLMQECGTELEGTSLWALAEAARKRGISAIGLEVSRAGLMQQGPPFLVWNPVGHYVAILKRDDKWQIYDPEHGSLQLWLTDSLPEEWRGAVLLLRPRSVAKHDGGTEQ